MVSHPPHHQSDGLLLYRDCDELGGASGLAGVQTSGFYEEICFYSLPSVQNDTLIVFYCKSTIAARIIFRSRREELPRPHAIKMLEQNEGVGTRDYRMISLLQLAFTWCHVHQRPESLCPRVEGRPTQSKRGGDS